MTQGLYWFGFETPYFPFEDGVSVLLEPMCSKRWGVTSFSSGEWTGVLLRVSYLSYVGDPSPLLYLKVGPIYRALLLCTEKSWWLESSCFVSRGSPLPQPGYGCRFWLASLLMGWFPVCHGPPVGGDIPVGGVSLGQPKGLPCHAPA